MNQPRFASITASLLARKGEARPWTEPEKQPLAWRPAESVAPPPPPPFVSPPAPAAPEPRVEIEREARAEWKKYVLRISHHDFERLGILAVKQGKTRQRLLQETVDQLFTGMTQTYGGRCPCLGDKPRP